MATEEAQLAAQDHAQRQAHLKQQCISTGGGPAAGGGGGGTRNTAVLTVAAACHNTPYAGKMCCIMYNTYYIILCINMYYVLVHPGFPTLPQQASSLLACFWRFGRWVRVVHWYTGTLVHPQSPTPQALIVPASSPSSLDIIDPKR
jgi:hypothetical protein